MRFHEIEGLIFPDFCDIKHMVIKNLKESEGIMMRVGKIEIVNVYGMMTSVSAL